MSVSPDSLHLPVASTLHLSKSGRYSRLEFVKTENPGAVLLLPHQSSDTVLILGEKLCRMTLSIGLSQHATDNSIHRRHGTKCAPPREIPGSPTSRSSPAS